jgi:hypothetical protein
VTGTEWIALAAVIATPVTAAIAAGATWFVARGQRGHERQLALDERTYAARSEAYPLLLEQASGRARTTADIGRCCIPGRSDIAVAR